MIFSQDTRTKLVKVSTLKNIKKKIDKCDSLRVAFDLKDETINALVESNMKTFEDFKIERDKKKAIQLDLDEKEKDMKKLLQKPNTGWIIPVAAGVIIGVILTGL